MVRKGKRIAMMVQRQHYSKAVGHIAESHRLYFWAALKTPLFYAKEKTLLLSGINAAPFNGVLRTAFPASSAAERIEQVSDLYGKRKVPFTWYVSNESRPSNLSDLLSDADFIQEGREWAAALNTSTLKTIKPPPPSITIKPVSHHKQMKQWADIYGRSMELSPEVADSYTHLFVKESASKPFRHFIASYKDKAAGVATLFFFERYIAIYNFAIDAKIESKELAPQFLKYLLSHAKRMGRSFVFAYVDRCDIGLFEKEHFDTLQTIDRWTLS